MRITASSFWNTQFNRSGRRPHRGLVGANDRARRRRARMPRLRRRNRAGAAEQAVKAPSLIGSAKQVQKQLGQPPVADRVGEAQ